MADAFLTRKGGEDVTPEVQAQEVLIDDIMTALVGKVQGANATADKILAGYKAYVGRELVEGTYESITGIEYGTVTVSSSTSITVQHGLGVTPENVILFAVNHAAATTAYAETALQITTDSAMRQNSSTGKTYNGFAATFDTTSAITSSLILATKNSSSITFSAISSSYPFKGEYIWIAIGGGGSN